MSTKHTPGPYILATWHTDHAVVDRYFDRTVTPRELLEAYDDMRAQRDALLATLESIVAACEGITANGHNYGDGWIAAHEKFGAFARAAIAAARGEG